MIGQDMRGARRVMVFIEKDGLIHGWEVLQPQRIEWDFTGTTGSTHAKVTVAGEFHRITRYGTMEEIASGVQELEQ